MRPRPAVALLEHQSSVPCRWPTTGTSGATRSAAAFTGVRWCRCRTSASAAPASDSARAQARDLVLVRRRRRVRRRHGPARRAGPRRTGASARSAAHRVGRLQRGRHVDDAHVEALVEGPRVAVALDRAADDADVDAVRTEGAARLPATCAEPPRGKNCVAIRSVIAQGTYPRSRNLHPADGYIRVMRSMADGAPASQSRPPGAPAPAPSRPRRRPSDDGARRRARHRADRAARRAGPWPAAGGLVRGQRRRRGAGRRLLHAAGRPSRWASCARAAWPAAHVPFAAPWGGQRACVHVDGGTRAIAAPRRAARRAARRPAPGRPAAGRDGRRRLRPRRPTPRASAPAPSSSTPTSPPGATRAPRSRSPASKLLAVACDGRSRNDAGLTLEELAGVLSASAPIQRSTSTAAARRRWSPAGGCATARAADFGVPEPGGRAVATALLFVPKTAA